MTDGNAFLSQTAIYQSSLQRDSGQSAGATIDQFSGTPVSDVSGFKEVASPWYSDQILPFDITLAGTNEQGAASAMKITGVEVLNEGTGVSIDDSVTETQCSFVARAVLPWQAVTSPFQSSLKGAFIALDQVFIATNKNQPRACGQKPRSTPVCWNCIWERNGYPITGRGLIVHEQESASASRRSRRRRR